MSAPPRKSDGSKKSDSSKKNFQVVGIRKEDYSVWERRAPLTPNHVKTLCDKGVKVIVQPSNTRIFTNDDYKNAGAEIEEDIDQADVIIGLKDIPVDKLKPDKTYWYYSHVTKGRPKFMPALKALLSRRIRLIENEEITETDGGTIPPVVFANFAGRAGFINILSGLGLRLLSLGFNTPFLNVGLAHHYKNLSLAKQSVREVGYEIALGNMPESVGPLVFVVLGIGNCSQGVQDVFEELPHEYVQVKDLPQVHKNGSLDKVYAALLDTKDFLRKKDGGDFDLDDFNSHPDSYESFFGKEIAQYASVIINCLKWLPKFPVVISKGDVKDLLKSNDDGNKGLPHRLIAICDVSADPAALGKVTKPSGIDRPFFIYNPEKDKHEMDFNMPGVVVSCIGNLPTQMAKEASEAFSSAIMPYIDSVLTSDAKKPLEDHDFSPAIRNAIVTSNGNLTQKFQYLKEFLKEE